MVIDGICQEICVFYVDWDLWCATMEYIMVPLCSHKVGNVYCAVFWILIDFSIEFDYFVIVCHWILAYNS